MLRSALRAGVVGVLVSACGDAPDGRATPDTVVEPGVLAAWPVDSGMGEIRGARLTADGLWVLRRHAPFLAFYARPDATPMVGLHEGAGPLEAQQVVSVESDRDGNAVVWDGLAGKLLRVAPDGGLEVVQRGEHLVQPVRTRLQTFLGAVPNQVAALDGGLLVGHANGPLRMATGLLTEAVVLAGSDGFEVLLNREADFNYVYSISQDRLELAPFPLWARCGRWGIANYSVVNGAVTKYRLTDGRLEAGASINIVHEFLPLGQSEVRSYMFHSMKEVAAGRTPDAELRRMVDEYPMAMYAKVSPYGPIYDGLLCAEDGAVWARRFRIAPGPDPLPELWEVYEDGPAYDQVQLPPGTRLVEVQDDQLLAIRRDSLGFEQVVAMGVNDHAPHGL